jgi:HPt (histidine-containing phosphotransfer) domain-containing protein
MTHEKNPPIDYSMALMRTGDDKEFLNELIDLYISDFNTRVSQLENAIMEKDYALILMLGHTLKGSSSNLCLTGLEEFSFQIERAGRNNNLKPAQLALKLLKGEFERFLNFLSLQKRRIA